MSLCHKKLLDTPTSPVSEIGGIDEEEKPNKHVSGSMNAAHSGQAVYVLHDPDYPLRLWPFARHIEQAYSTHIDSGSLFSDRMWSILCAFVAFNSRPGLELILHGLRAFILLASVAVFSLTMTGPLYMKGRRKLLILIRVPFGLCISALAASAYRRKLVCITSWPQFVQQILLLRSRIIVPSLFTGTFQLGVVHHLIFQSAHSAWLLLSVNQQDCANMAQNPVLASMLMSIASYLERTPGLFVVSSLIRAIRSVSMDGDISAADICVATRGGLQISMLVLTTVLLYITELRGRIEFGRNRQLTEKAAQFIWHHWFLHITTGLGIFATFLALAGSITPVINSLPAAQALLFEWGEVAASCSA